MVKPGKIARGKDEIKRAFIAIAKYFNNSVVPTQGTMMVINTRDTALVISQTLIATDKKLDSEYPLERRATYIYRLVNGNWLCAIDNSYGVTLLDE